MIVVNDRRRIKPEKGILDLNSSLMMSLGAGAIQVSGGPQASSREEVSMATLEAGTTLQQPLTDTVTLKNFSGDTYL